MSQTDDFALITTYLDKCFVDAEEQQTADGEIARKILGIILNNCNVQDDRDLIVEVKLFYYSIVLFYKLSLTFLFS